MYIFFLVRAMTKDEIPVKTYPPLPFKKIAVEEDRDATIFQDIDQASLLVLAPVIGRACIRQNKTYFRCRTKDEHPSTCVEEGIEVHHCVNRV